MTAPQSGNIVEVQALRAIAVSLVVLYHGDVPFFPGGYIGVDVFFVISGYLITSLLVREHNNNGRIALSRFYARRIRRLLPAALVMTLGTVTFCWFAYSPLQFKELTASAIASTVYLSNVWFYQLATNYLAPGAHSNPFLHTWSLSVEEQFYIVWPLIILIVARKSAGGIDLRNAVLGLGLVSLVSLVMCILQTSTDQPLAFFGTHARAWEFGAGGILALVHSRSVILGAPSSNFFLVAGLLLIFAPAFLFDDSTLFPGTTAIWPVMGTVFVIHSSRGPASNISLWMRSRPVQFIGDISYSFYLWHWPTSLALNSLDIMSRPLWLMLYILVSIILAIFSYYIVENPVRFNRFLASKAAYSYVVGFTTSSVVAGAILLARTESANELETASQAALLLALDDNAATYSDGCHLRQSATEVLGECIYGSKEAVRTIVIFGDSHAANWFPALESISLNTGFRLISLTKSECPSIFIEPFIALFKRQYTECTIWRENAYAFITELRPDLVILANSDRYAIEESSDSSIDEERWSSGVTEATIRLEELGLNFALMKDTPTVGYEPLHCLSRARWRHEDPGSICTLKPQKQIRERIYAITENIVKRSKTGSTIDMNSDICPSRNHCPLERDGMVLYRDSHHLTASFSRQLSPALLEKLQNSGLL